MASNDDDGFFSDDDFDTLPVNTLHELEQSAVLATQQANPLLNPSQDEEPSHVAVPLPTPSRTKFRYLNSDNHANYQARDSRQTDHQLPSSDYGNLDHETLDEEFLGANVPPVAAETFPEYTFEKPSVTLGQHAQWQGQPSKGTFARHEVQHPLLGSRQQGQGPEQDPFIADDSGFYGNVEIRQDDHNVGNLAQADGGMEDDPVLALQAQVQELLRQKESLQQSLKKAEQASLTKTGEIAIIRGKLSNIEKENQSRVEQLQKHYLEQSSRQRAELEAAREKAKAIATENQFLKADITEGGKRIRKLEKTSKLAERGTASRKDAADVTSVTTPKKPKGLPYRDGFDDDEIMMVSPSKGAGKPKVNTPKIGNKRKRPAVDDSPVKPLQLSQSKEQPAPPSPERSRTAQDIPRADDAKAQLYQKVLNHHAPSGPDRTLELLASFAFPSAPEKRISSIIMDHMMVFGARSSSKDPSIDVCDACLSIWSQCLNEKYYKPLSLIVDLVTFVLSLNPLSTAPGIADNAIELVQNTSEIIGYLRLKHQSLPKFSSELDVTACLSFLELVTQGCVTKPVVIKDFWTKMRWDFVMMELQYQPIEDISIMVRMLCTSVFEDCFGPVFGDNAADRKLNEDHIIDQATQLLAAAPKLPDRDDPYTTNEIRELKLEVLRLLVTMVFSHYGGKALATHAFVLGRLVWLMNDELECLYDYAACRAESAEIINLAIRLIYHLVTGHGSDMDLQARLAVIPGGNHKYLVSLTRLAFSEPFVLEAEIENETVDAAHQLLENLVTPEEGEALLSAFSSASK